MHKEKWKREAKDKNEKKFAVQVKYQNSVKGTGQTRID